MVDNTLLFAAPILLPLATAFLLPIFHRITPRLVPIACILATGAALLILISFGNRVFNGEILVTWMGGWTPRDGLAIGISLSIDAWSLLVALLASLIGLAALVYSIVYMRYESGKEAYYVLVMLLIAAMIGFALSGDLFNQFVWLEIFSVASFALTGFHVDQRGTVEAAFKYLITNSMASFFVVVGLALLYMQTGALNIAHIARDLQPTTASWVAVGLLVGGYATKAALVPWHFWLPDAHTVAPAPVHALFSGGAIKIGIYAVARSLFTLVSFPSGSIVQTLLLIIAAASMLTGGIQMVQQQPMKRILAFSSVSQMGYVALGLALGTPLGIVGAAIHMIHHALVKAAFLMGVGMVAWRTGIHDVSEGGGLARRMPVTCTLMCLAALSLSGMPFFSGYISKTLLEDAALEAHYQPIVWIAVFSSMLTFAGTVRLLWSIFGRNYIPDNLADTTEVPFLALLPIGVLIAGSIIVGCVPGFFVKDIALSVAESLHARDSYITQVMGEDTAVNDHELHIEHAPEPLKVLHWWIPALVALGGSLMAYLLLNPVQRSWLSPVQFVARMSRDWHSGIVTDYALWNAFGTSVILMAIVIAKYMERL